MYSLHDYIIVEECWLEMWAQEEQTKSIISSSSSFVKPGTSYSFSLTSIISLTKLTLHSSFSGMVWYSIVSISSTLMLSTEFFPSSIIKYLKFLHVVVLTSVFDRFNNLFNDIFLEASISVMNVKYLLNNCFLRCGSSVKGSTKYL